MTTRIDLEIYQGETFKHTFPALEDDGGNLIDLTKAGYTAEMELRDHPLDGDLIISFSDGNELTLNADGTIDLEVSSITTEEFDFFEVVYDLRFSTPDGDVRYPYKGHILLDHSVTTS